MRCLAEQVRALEREVERRLAQRKVMVVSGPAVITVEPGAKVEVVRQAGTRVEVDRPEGRFLM
jgi:hypothetical protein